MMSLIDLYVYIKEISRINMYRYAVLVIIN